MKTCCVITLSLSLSMGLKVADDIDVIDSVDGGKVYDIGAVAGSVSAEFGIDAVATGAR